MKRRKLLFLLAFMIAFSANGINAKAEEASEGVVEEITYGQLTDSEISMMSQIFDVDYYKANNKDLVDTIGDNADLLFEHFCNFGIFEGRACTADFNPSAYASAYSDLRDVFGSDIVKYYDHYYSLGINEERNITTIEECANANITVEMLVGHDRITPVAYQLGVKLGTNDYISIQKSIDNAIKNGNYGGGHSSGGSSSSADNNIIVTDGEIDTLIAEAHGLTKAGELTFTRNEKYKTYEGDVSFYIYVGSKGYAAKIDVNNQGNPGDYVFTTDDFVDNNSSWYARVGVNAEAPWDTEEDKNIYFFHHGYQMGGKGSDLGHEFMINDQGTSQIPRYYKGEFYHNQVIDPNGNKDSVYNVGIKLEENEDKNLNITLGIYNDDTNFAGVTHGIMVTPKEENSEEQVSESNSQLSNSQEENNTSQENNNQNIQ